MLGWEEAPGHGDFLVDRGWTQIVVGVAAVEEDLGTHKAVTRTATTAQKDVAAHLTAQALGSVQAQGTDNLVIGMTEAAEGAIVIATTTTEATRTEMVVATAVVVEAIVLADEIPVATAPTSEDTARCVAAMTTMTQSDADDCFDVGDGESVALYV